MQKNIMTKSVGEAITESFRVFNFASSVTALMLMMIIRVIIDANLESYTDMFVLTA